MILNAPIILSLFLSALGLLLGLAAVVVLLRRSVRPLPTVVWGEPSGRWLEGQGAYLVLLLLLTAFGLRVIAWPLSYLALGSAVPHVSGAMCIFGVTRLCPLWANLLQAVRPLLVFALGGWIALRLTRSSRERGTPGGPAAHSPLELPLFLVSLLLLIVDCLLEWVVLLSLRPDQPVYCCGSVYDLPDRFSALLPGSLFGAQHAHLALPLLVGCVLFCAALCLAAGLVVWQDRGTARWRQRMSRVVAPLLFLLLPVVLGVAGVAAMEVVTPRLTGLPYHHCLYCLLGKTVYGPLMAVALAAGLLCSAWGALLLPWGRPERNRPRRSAGLLLVGGICLLLFLVVVLLGLSRSGSGGSLGVCDSCGARLFDTVYLVEVVSGEQGQTLYCSPGCAMVYIKQLGGEAEADYYVTVRDEFTGKRLDSGAAYFVEGSATIEGLPPGNRWHTYQYAENAHIMAFQMDGNVVADPFSAGGHEAQVD